MSWRPLCPLCQTGRMARWDGKKLPGAIPGKKYLVCVPCGYVRPVRTRPKKPR